jgi:hypothetical protein
MRILSFVVVATIILAVGAIQIVMALSLRARAPGYISVPSPRGLPGLLRLVLVLTSCVIVAGAPPLQAAEIGEVIASDIPLASAVSLTRATPTNITSVSLTPGDWTCFSNVQLNTGASTVISILSAWVSTSSASIPPAFEAVGLARVYPPRTPGIVPSVNPTAVHFSLSATTTVYLEASSRFTTSTLAIYGNLSCRRAR